MWFELRLCVEHCGRSPKGAMRSRTLNAPDPPQSNMQSLMHLHVRGPVAPPTWLHSVGTHYSENLSKADSALRLKTSGLGHISLEHNQGRCTEEMFESALATQSDGINQKRVTRISVASTACCRSQQQLDQVKGATASFVCSSQPSLLGDDAHSSPALDLALRKDGIWWIRFDQ